MHVEKKVDSNGFIVCALATPLRQRAWHSPIVEDAEGRSLFLANRRRDQSIHTHAKQPMSITTVSIHDVVSVGLGRFRALDGGTWVRSIEVIDKHGHLFDIALFADSSGTLALIEAMEPTEESLAQDAKVAA